MLLTALSPCFCSATYLPRHGTSHNGLGPNTHISSQENAPTSMATADLVEAVLQLRFLLSG